MRSLHSLDYTVLLCGDLPATKAFYRDVLGFAIEVDTDDWVSFRVGATILALRPSETGGAAVQLAFRVPPPAVDECHAELVANGITIRRGPVDLPAWRHRAIFFHDPEENIIEIYAEY